MKKTYVAFIFAIFSASPVWAATQTVTLLVPDMSCPACPITVKKALSKVEGVSSINVNFDKREATVVFDDKKTKISNLTEATELAGYPSTEKQ
jgi:mercuric ion binding protein